MPFVNPTSLVKFNSKVQDYSTQLTDLNKEIDKQNKIKNYFKEKEFETKDLDKKIKNQEKG